jgi:hypothetical protein
MGQIAADVGSNHEVRNRVDDDQCDIPCCTFKIKSPDETIGPESAPAIMNRVQIL